MVNAGFDFAHPELLELSGLHWARMVNPAGFEVILTEGQATLLQMYRAGHLTGRARAWAEAHDQVQKQIGRAHV